ncbi:aminoglycoside phosphotransferase [Curtobacterium sp. Leaf261]|nr:aminoglycoside phosphotransferase [Curtobacterium sp. Leaf261]
MLGRPVRFERELLGGTHAVTIVVRDGDRPLVVRRFPPGDDAVGLELAAFPVIAPLGDLVPQVVASGGGAEQPVIVTTLLPGGAPPPDLTADRIATAMAAALALVHAVPVGTGVLPSTPSAPRIGDGPLARRARAEWSALDLSAPVLTHRDFWCGNALWVGGEITGIVDWTSASTGPRGVDLAWCRQDLVLLGAPAAADLLLREYEGITGQVVADIGAWDVQAAASAEDRVETWAPNYVGIGRTDLTGPVLRQRLDAWNAAL